MVSEAVYLIRNAIEDATGMGDGAKLIANRTLDDLLAARLALEAFQGDVQAGCDIQRGDTLYRQVPVVIGPGKTQAQLDLETANDLIVELQHQARTLRHEANGWQAKYQNEKALRLRDY